MRKKSEIEKEKITDEYMPIIYKSSASMLRLVSNLLDTAKVESGKYQIVKEPAGDIRKVIEERINFYEPSARAQNVKLKYVVTDDVPRSINLDPNALVEVFNNFISNSLKFSNDNGEIVIQAFIHNSDQTVVEEAKKAGIAWFVKEDDHVLTGLTHSLVVAVTDNGIGISRQNMSLLFNKFRQFKSIPMAEGKKGTGLGLVIAKGIVEAHGGVVGAESEEGKGSTFYFTIPI
jgi:signal transduction histidine kinase